MEYVLISPTWTRVARGQPVDYIISMRKKPKSYLSICLQYLELYSFTTFLRFVSRRSFDYHVSESSKEDMAGLVCYMYMETFADRNFERPKLADFALTVLRCYRDNPYHNAEHAFCFTHTMFLILVNNTGYFDFIEVSL